MEMTPTPMLASLLKTSGNQDLVLVLIVIWFKYSIEELEGFCDDCV